MTRPTAVSKTSKRRKYFGSSYQKLARQDCEEVVRHSTYQIWQAHSDKVRTSSWEEHRTSDMAEGHFQFSTRSHEKEGSFQVFCIQVTPEAVCSHSFSFSYSYIQEDRIGDGKQHCIRCYSSVFEHQSQETTTSSHNYHHVGRSSLRSVPADEVDDFHISGCTSGPHSKSSTVVLQQSPLWEWTSWRKGLFNLQEWDSKASQWNTVLGRRTQETHHQKSRGHHISTSRSITVHSRTGIRTHHTGNSTSIHFSCAASTDYHRTACYSDCESTATIGASIIISTANFICCCGWPTALDFQTDDFQSTFSCTFTTGGESAQHFYIIHSLRSYSQCAHISIDGHTTAIFTLSTSTSTVNSVIFHSSWTFKTSQPVQPAESKSAQISRLARTSHTKPSPFKGHPNHPKTIIKLHVCAQKQKSTPSNTYTSPQYRKKLCEWMCEC